ncbi:ComEA family DNA-binding protein [Kitasatospora sp. NBC_01560]|uniref:helix-hairpin-helix domain-containing protein n=1 Tax=Kitasatospora sp. NBC_01560 TaxID=2975965 RepID=UPI00386FA697
MTSLKFGATRRQEISDTARLRMAVLLPAGAGPADGPVEGPVEGPVGGAAEGAVGPAEGLADGAAGADGPSTTGGSARPVRRPSPGPLAEAARPELPFGTVVGDDETGDSVVRAQPVRSGLRFGPAVMLDRRAVLGLVVLLLLAVGYGVQHFWLARPRPVEVPAVAGAPVEPGVSGPAPSEPGAGPGPPGAGGASGAGTASGPEASPVVVVDIGGRVHSPGVHTLPGGSRVADALRVAGGPLPETDTKNLNLARVLADGEQILVGESAAPPVGGAGTGAGPAAASAPRQPVSLNHATLEQLDTLPGVGPTLAQRILAFRVSHGSFRALDQLRQVSGIGERTYAEIKPMLTL